MSRGHAAIAERLWEAVSAGDVDTLETLCTEDLRWHTSGRGPRAGTVRGRTAVFEHLARLGEDADRYASELEDVLVGEHATALLYRVTGVRGSRKLDTGYILLLRIEDGKLVEAWSVPRDQYAVDEFWSE